VTTVVDKWTGAEVRALREARRMTTAQFAELMTVTERMVTLWEARGKTITPRPVNQKSLDDMLAAAPPDVHERFAHATGLANDLAEDDPGIVHQQMRHPVDGKLMTLVPSGVYLAGPDNQPRWLSAFYIDVFPTTNSDYSRFVLASGQPAPEHWDNGRCPDALREHPVVWVAHTDAAAYAAWAKKDLPSAEQWEKAARGPQGGTYPWGDAASVAKCNCRESGIGSTTPAERYHSGASPYGVYDLCGNTWEWCSTATVGDRYELKGSAWTSPFARCTPSTFNDADQSMRDDDTSFRCISPA